MTIFLFTCFHCDQGFLADTPDVCDSRDQPTCDSCYDDDPYAPDSDPDLGAVADMRYSMYTSTLLGVA